MASTAQTSNKISTTVIFIEKSGRQKAVQAENGLSLMVAAIENNIAGIKAICNGCCSCGTCHVAIEANFLPKTSTLYSGEQQVIDALPNTQAESRLACQVIVTEALEGMKVFVK